MSHTAYRPAPTSEIGAGQRWLAGVLTALGFVGAAIGLWYAVGPDDGSIQIFNWTASIQAAPAWLAPLLLIVGGVLMTSTMVVEAVLDGRSDQRAASLFEGLLALVGLAAVVFGIVIAI